MKNILKKVSIIFFLLILSLFLFINFFLYPTPKDFPIQDYKTPILIAHAGGQINGQNYTNSKEAVLESLNKGMEFVELDFMFTSDNKMAAMHAYQDFNEKTGYGYSENPIYERDFRSRKIYGNLTPLLGDDVSDIFNENNAILVSDKFTDFDLLLNKFDKNRLIVEVFSYHDYAEALRRGIKYPMLSVWVWDKSDMEWGLDHYMKYIQLGKVKMISIPVELIEICPDKLKKLHDKGVAIFAFTSNDKEFIKKYGGSVVTGFYTDSIRNSDLN